MAAKFIQFQASEDDRTKLSEIAEHMGVGLSEAIRKLIAIAYENMVINEMTATVFEGEIDYRKIAADGYLFAPMSAHLIVADAHMAILGKLKEQPILFRMVAAYLESGGKMDAVIESSRSRTTELLEVQNSLREQLREIEQKATGKQE